MPPSSLTHTLRRLWALDKFAYSLRVFIALAGALLLCWWQGRIELLIPLFLGIIAWRRPTTTGSAACKRCW